MQVTRLLILRLEFLPDKYLDIRSRLSPLHMSLEYCFSINSPNDSAISAFLTLFYFHDEKRKECVSLYFVVLSKIDLIEYIYKLINNFLNVL